MSEYVKPEARTYRFSLGSYRGSAITVVLEKNGDSRSSPRVTESSISANISGGGNGEADTETWLARRVMLRTVKS